MKNGLIAVLLFIFSFFLIRDFAPSNFGAGDYLEYWSGARLFWSGGNPYDLVEMSALQKPYNQAPVTILLWNPPFIFPLILPFAAFPFIDATVLWLLAMGIAVVASVRALTSVIQEQNWHAEQLVFIFTFYPIALSLYYGQISPLLLLGLVGFLSFFFRASHGEFAAGVFLSLTFLKPHALYLIYIWLTLRWLLTGGFRGVAGLLTGALVLMLPSLIFRPDVISLYSEAMRSPPIYWQTPTLGSWLQGGLGKHETWVRLLPSLMCAVSVALYLVVNKRALSDKSFLYKLIPLSLLTSPYTWQFDHILLLPTALFLLHQARETGRDNRWAAALVICLLISANLVVLFTAGGTPMQYFVWYPALLGVMAILWGKAFRKIHSNEGSLIASSR